MTGKKEKHISGAMYSTPNLEHNLRTHIPPNSVEERWHLNMVYTDDWGITLQQIYEKLFAEHYRVWRERKIKKGRGKRFSPTYYEKIEQDKQKHLCYEIIWQIGDMRDTGFVYTPEDANKAQDLLDKFAKYLLELPEVCVVTEKELNDPNWKPPFEAVLQEMMLKEFGWERFYKGSNPRENLTLSDYRREKAAEMAKEEERKLEDIRDKVTAGQATIQAQAEQMEAILEYLDKGAEAERQLRVRLADGNAELNEVLQDLADKSYELDEVKQDLTDKKSEVWEQERKLKLIKEDADETIQKAQFAEELIDYFKNTNSGEREKAYFEKMLDLKYENECLKRENQDLKTENRVLKTKLEKAYDFMRQFTINGMNMLEQFLKSIGAWVQQKVAGMSR